MTGDDLLPPEGLVQLLDERGRQREHDRFAVDLPGEKLADLYRHMVVARRVDRQGLLLARQGQLGVYTSLLGQEAAQVGSASALAAQDWVFPSYREGAALLVRGVDPVKVLHQYRGTWLFDHDPHESNFGLWTTPIGTQTLHATGFAMGAKTDGRDLVVLTYLGDGATSEGDPHEAMNFAAVHGAPCIFFVQNNQYAISVPVARQTRAPSIVHKGVGYGIPGFRVDGNDVLACYAVTKEAVERARAGGGPTLIEALTYRMEGHTTADDPSRYRTEEDVAAWRTRDPIDRYRTYLLGAGLIDHDSVEDVDAEAEHVARRLREEISDAPDGDPLELFEHVYVDPPAHLGEQREQLRRELEAPADVLDTEREARPGRVGGSPDGQAAR